MGSRGRVKNSSEEYHIFDRERSSWSPTHEFVDDGGKTAQWMTDNSNNGELISDIEQNGDADAFRSWARGHFMFGQQYDGFSKMSSLDQERTRKYDKYLDQSINDKAMIVTRLTDFKILNNGKDLDVRKFDSPQAVVDYLNKDAYTYMTLKGNMSFAAGKEGLSIGNPVSYDNVMVGKEDWRGKIRKSDWNETKMLEVRYRIPAKSQGAGMWIGDSRINSWGDKQSEYMSNRDVEVTRDKAYYDESRGVFVVYIDFAGRGSHNYK